MASRAGEINTRSRHLLRNKSLFGPLQNDRDNLSNHALAFLLSSFTGEKTMSLCRKPIFNLKPDQLHGGLLSCLEKVK